MSKTSTSPSTRAMNHFIATALPYQWVVAGVSVVIASPLIAIGLAIGGFLNLEGYDHRISKVVNEQVAMLLAGEQLAPPAPLPPASFKK